MKLSSLIGAFATFTALYATSTTTGDKPIFTMKLTVQCNDEEECDNGLPTPFVTQLQDGKRIHNSSIDFAERDAKARSHLGFTVFGQTISEVIYDGTTDRERQFRVDGMHNWKTKSAKYNLLCNVTFDQDPAMTVYELDMQNEELGLKVDEAGKPKVECVVSLQAV